MHLLQCSGHAGNLALPRQRHAIRSRCTALYWPLRFTHIIAAFYRPSGLVRHLRGLKEVSLYGHRGHDFSRLRRSVKIVRIMVRFRQLAGWQLLLRGGRG